MDSPVKISDANIAILSLEGLNKVEIAKKTGKDRGTIANILNKDGIRQIIMDGFAEHNFTISMLLKKNIDMLDAKKEIPLSGELVEVEDNVAQATAMKEINQIYGIHAPKQLDVRASAAEASTEELADQVESSLQEFRVAAKTEQSPNPQGSDSTQ